MYYKSIYIIFKVYLKYVRKNKKFIRMLMMINIAENFFPLKSKDDFNIPESKGSTQVILSFFKKIRIYQKERVYCFPNWVVIRDFIQLWI